VANLIRLLELPDNGVLDEAGFDGHLRHMRAALQRRFGIAGNDAAGGQQVVRPAVVQRVAATEPLAVGESDCAGDGEADMLIDSDVVIVRVQVAEEVALREGPM
jgi:hypothetical protein